MRRNTRIIEGATPRLAKILSHKYANLAAPSVVEDMLENHGRQITISYMQKLVDYVGSIAQAKEESWEYQLPKLDEPVSSIGISLDGAYVLTKDSGYREAMVGSISFYDKEGERLHTTYTAAAPEYGKETFYKRLSLEISRAKKLYPIAASVGIADGAQSNWSFLELHTDKQVLDFWHASEYLSKASHALFKEGQEDKRKEWLDNRCHDLKHKKGASVRILNELKAVDTKSLSEAVKESLESAITYYANNTAAGRMKYYKCIQANLPIGSGVTEAACKTIVKQRLGGSGMRWKDKGIKMILSLRSLVKTKGRWNQFWGKINLAGVPCLS